MLLKRQLQLWGVKNLRTDDVAKVLEHLYVDKEMNVAEIAREFKATAPGVRWLLERFKIPIRLRAVRLLVKARELGYRSLDDYFAKSAEKTFKDMAGELGVSAPTITRHYKLFLSRKSRRGEGGDKKVAA